MTHLQITPRFVHLAPRPFPSPSLGGPVGTELPLVLHLSPSSDKEPVWVNVLLPQAAVQGKKGKEKKKKDKKLCGVDLN